MHLSKYMTAAASHCQSFLIDAFPAYFRVCLKKHFRNLYARFAVYFVFIRFDVAWLRALVQTKSPTNCDVYLTESVF